MNRVGWHTLLFMTVTTGTALIPSLADYSLGTLEDRMNELVRGRSESAVIDKLGPPDEETRKTHLWRKATMTGVGGYQCQISVTMGWSTIDSVNLKGNIGTCAQYYSKLREFDER
jgi:hypothetical protein